MKSVLHSGKDQPSVTVVHALHVKGSYESMELQHTVLNNVIVLVGILRWQLFYWTRSLFMWNISAVLVHWLQISVLWHNGLIVKPIPGLKNITGHPLVDKQEVVLPPLPSTVGYKLEWRRLSVFIYFSYTQEIHDWLKKTIGYRIINSINEKYIL